MNMLEKDFEWVVESDSLGTTSLGWGIDIMMIYHTSLSLVIRTIQVAFLSYKGCLGRIMVDKHSQFLGQTLVDTLILLHGPPKNQNMITHNHSTSSSVKLSYAVHIP